MLWICADISLSVPTSSCAFDTASERMANESGLVDSADSDCWKLLNAVSSELAVPGLPNTFCKRSTKLARTLEKPVSDTARVWWNCRLSLNARVTTPVRT